MPASLLVRVLKGTESVCVCGGGKCLFPHVTSPQGAHEEESCLKGKATFPLPYSLLSLSRVLQYHPPVQQILAE